MAYSVEAFGMSVSAHSRPSKIIGCGRTTYGRNQNTDANPVDMCFSGEADRIGFSESKEWVSVKEKRRRSAKALVSSTLQYLDTKALPRRSVVHPKGEVTGKMTSISGHSDAVILRRKHLTREHVCGKQSLSGSAMMNENTTNEKSEWCNSIVRSEKG